MTTASVAERSQPRPAVLVAGWLLVLAWGLPLAGLASSPVLAEKADMVETLSTVIVNGVPIAEDEVTREVERLAPVAEYHNLSKERWQAIRKQAIENIVDKELFYREALHRGIGWDEQWVEFTYAKYREKYTADKQMQLALADEEVKNRLHEDLRRSYVITKLWEQGKQASMPKDVDVEAYFNEHREKYRSPKTIKTVELMIEMPPSSTKQEWDKARQRINSLYKEVRKSKSFDAYKKQAGLKITEKTIHEGMRGYDVRGLDKLADGDILKPLFTLNGYILLKKVKSVPQQAFSFDEVREQVKNDVLTVKYRQWFDDLRQGLRDNSKIIIGAGPTYVGR